MRRGHVSLKRRVRSLRPGIQGTAHCRCKAVNGLGGAEEAERTGRWEAGEVSGGGREEAEMRPEGTAGPDLCAPGTSGCEGCTLFCRQLGAIARVDAWQ